jgi:hypothetical protein
MAHDEVINAKDSITTGAYSKDGNLWNVSGNGVDSYTESLRGPESELPANNKAEGGVQWLGSSYSGADIKIVVHLYDEISYREEALLAEDVQFYFDLSNAFQSIADNADSVSDISNKEKRNAFINTWEGQDSRVLGHILSFLNAFNIVPKRTRASAIRTAAKDNSSDYMVLGKESQNKLNSLEALKKDSFSTFTLATAQTFSLQTHREKHPVRALGNSNVLGYTRGARTVAGSIIFTMFNEHALASLIRRMGSTKNKFDPSSSINDQVSSLLIDQLPPIDITIVFANEYGSLSRGAVYGVEFLNSGVTLSIEDILTEEVVNFVARDADPIVSQGSIGIDRKQRGMHFNIDGKPTTGSDLIFANKSSYDDFLERLKVRRQFRNR